MVHSLRTLFDRGHATMRGLLRPCDDTVSPVYAMNKRKHFFGISTSQDLHERLVKVAKDMGLSVSALVERIIEENLEQYEPTGAKVRRLSPDFGK